MGYYTRYEFQWFFLEEEDGMSSQTKKEREITLKEFMYNFTNEEFHHLLWNQNKENEPINFDNIEIVSPEQEMKWYGHEEQMMILTQTFPDLVFALRGIGEERGDSWLKVFCQGRFDLYTEKSYFNKPKNLPENITEKIKNTFDIEYKKEQEQT